LNFNYKYLQCSLYDSEVEGKALLKSFNFNAYRITREAEIEVKTCSYESDYNLEPLMDLSKDDFNQLIEIIKFSYRESHLDNPVKIMADQAWLKLIQNELIYEGSFVLKDQNQVIGYALMHKCDENSVDLGWRGSSSEYNEERSKIILSLSKAQNQYCLDHEIKTMYVEIDDTDIWACELLKLFELKNEKKWISYQKAL